MRVDQYYLMDNLEPTMDLEERPVAEKHLLNTTVKNLTWRGVTVTVKDRETKEPKTIVENVEGIVEAGEFNLSTPVTDNSS
jgi:hypothetical protein